MIVVADASTLVAWLVDSGPTGEWAGEVVAEADLIAPHLALAETANILRRAAQTGAITNDTATLAHADLLGTTIDLHPYAPHALRAWELRETVTAYDAWYVALAEAFEAPLVTLDVRLARAPGPTCAFLTPPP